MKAVAKRIGTARNRRAVTALLASSLAMVLVLFPHLSVGDEPAPVGKPVPGKPATKSAPRSPRKHVKLPGLVINLEERCVDLEGSVCLDRGYLELIACTKGSKEHESIVAIEARPMHIHAALLLLGANPGNPAMRRPIDEQGSRWIDVPPKGDPVDVSLVFKNREGKMVERPISDFVARSGNPKVLGTWTVIDQVETIDEFNPDKKMNPGRAPFKEMTFKDKGRTDEALWIWSGNTLMDLDRYQALKMTVKAIDGSDCLFIEAGGFSTRNPVGWQSPLYVMKRAGK